MKGTRATEKRLNVRMGQAEYARLQLLAARSGTTMSHYLRALIRREIERQAFSALRDLTEEK